MDYAALGDENAFHSLPHTLAHCKIDCRAESCHWHVHSQEIIPQTTDEQRGDPETM